jgi:transcriptional regulator with XRE-family HTH domain
MRKRNVHKVTAAKLAQQLLRASHKTGDAGLAVLAAQIRDRIKVPMPEVLARVPGSTFVEKAAFCGVSRQAYYAWLHGNSRPTGKQAERIAYITGYDVEEIRGKPLPPPARASKTARAARRV